MASGRDRVERLFIGYRVYQFARLRSALRGDTHVMRNDKIERMDYPS